MPLKRFTLAAVHHRAKRTGRGQAYIDDVLAAAEQQDESHVWLTAESIRAIRDKWEPTHPSAPPRPATKPDPPPPFVENRLITCRSCEHCIDGRKCGVLAHRGRPGVLMHPKGVPNRRAKCPAGKWPSLEGNVEFPHRKVGFLAVAYTDCGGTEVWHQTLLPRIKDDVSGFVCLEERLAKGDFSLLGCKAGIGMEAAKRLAESCDVLVVWGIGERLREILESVESKPAVISVAHCDRRSQWTKDFMDGQASVSDHNVAICRTGMETVPDERRHLVSLIHNAVDPDRVVPTETRAETRAKYGVSDDEKLVVCISRVSQEKGIHTVARAVAQLGAPYRLLVAGTAADWCKGYAHELMDDPSLPNTEFIGRVSTPANLLNAADLYCADSEYEGYGLSTAEAIIAGVPVLSTPVGFLEDDPSFARTIPLGSTPGVWAAHIEDIIDRPPKLLLERAKWIVRKDHGPEAWVDKWLALLDSVAGMTKGDFRA